MPLHFVILAILKRKKKRKKTNLDHSNCMCFCAYKVLNLKLQQTVLENWDHLLGTKVLKDKYVWNQHYKNKTKENLIKAIEKQIQSQL